jgi:F0F1-type ATP synthase beta subunit
LAVLKPPVTKRMAGTFTTDGKTPWPDIRDDKSQALLLFISLYRYTVAGPTVSR